MIITKKAFPRAALIGNPSDGYFGKTIAFTFTNFSAQVTLYESPELEILPNTRDHSKFGSIGELADDVRAFGYYGGIRLLKASVKRFFDFCQDNGIQLHDKNFTIRYGSNIPHLVGLAGSSAIITACVRSLMTFYGVSIPRPEMANLILSVEHDELGISAGLQDRVAQVYQGLVYMDFDRDLMEKQGFGCYEQLDEKLLPNLYIAYSAEMSEGSDVVHNNLRFRFEKNEPDVLDAMNKWRDLTDEVRDCLQKNNSDELGPLLNKNFDLRSTICRISDGNMKMIETARSCGCSAKFTGSGGTIIGTFKDKPMFDSLKSALAELNVETIIPVTGEPAGEQ